MNTFVSSLRIPPALLARADDLVPLVAATGELVHPVRATVLRLALAEGLRVLARLLKRLSRLMARADIRDTVPVDRHEAAGPRGNHFC